MDFKYNDVSSCTQSPLSVLDLAALDSPASAVKPQPSTSGLPPRASQSSLGSGQRSSIDPYTSSDRINFSISACKPVLTVCPTSPTRPKAQSRSRLRTARLSRSSSLNDSKVCVLQHDCASLAQAEWHHCVKLPVLTFQSPCACRSWWPPNYREPLAWPALTCLPLGTTLCLKE